MFDLQLAQQNLLINLFLHVIHLYLADAQRKSLLIMLTTLYSIKHTRFVRILLQLFYMTFHIGRQPVADEKPMYGLAISIRKFPAIVCEKRAS